MPVSRWSRRNLALWNDCTLHTWARVVALYMLTCSGEAIVGYVVLPLVHGGVSIGSWWPSAPSASHPTLTDRVVFLLTIVQYVEYVAVTIAGVAVWYRPARLLNVLWIVCPISTIAAALRVSESLVLYFENPFSLPRYGYQTTGGSLLRFWSCVLAIVTLWTARRVSAGRRLGIFHFIARVLFVFGIWALVAKAIQFIDPGPMGLVANIGPRVEWRYELLYFVAPVGALTCLVIGGLLLASRSKHLVACASILLLSLAAKWTMLAVLFGWSCYINTEIPLAVVFLIFLLLYRPRGDPANPTCDVCGYSLRGLPERGHRCPECGSPYELAVAAATVAVKRPGE